MKKSLSLVGFVMIACVGLSVFAADTAENWNFGGKVNFDHGAIVQIEGTEVTSSAAELNIMDGVTATASEINAAADPDAGEASTSVSGTTYSVSFDSTAALNKGTVQSVAEGAGAGSACSNNSFMVWHILRMNNDAGGTSTQAVNYVSIYARATDVTGGTEDALVEFAVMNAGTTTTVFSVTGAGLLTATTFAGSGASLTSLPAAQLTGNAPLAAITNVLITTAANTALSGSNTTFYGTDNAFAQLGTSTNGLKRGALYVVPKTLDGTNYNVLASVP